MKTQSIVLAIALCAAFVAGCSTRPAGRLAYRESQFASRLEYLRFCQNNELQTRRCD
jgi:PBP1b-binding outer membrane lipoprotein LpoB